MTRYVCMWILWLLVLLPWGAQADDREAALHTRLAAVQTGNAAIDQHSLEGLRGLTQALHRRTSFEGGEPVLIDIESDDPTLYPFLYWPLSGSQRLPSDAAIQRLNHYVKGGGTLLFDTRGETVAWLGQGDLGGAVGVLFNLLSKLDVGQMIALPDGHVLNHSFYLLQKYAPPKQEGQILLERTNAQDNDGVASVIVTTHDWASDWSEASVAHVRQREYALRFGINLLMYTLTGSYKADQLHLRKIMERLGQ